MPTGMEFELTLRLLLGRRASVAASASENPKRRSAWLRNAMLKIEHEVIALDTTDRHKQMMLAEIEASKDAITSGLLPSWSLVYRLLRLCARLLGFDFTRGAKCHTATFWQSIPQNLNTIVFTGGDIMQDYYDKQNAIAVRRDVVRHLKAQGLTDYRIALVLNVTEYQVKKLRAQAQASV